MTIETTNRRTSCAAVVLNWNNAVMTDLAVTSVAEQVDAVYVVDNGSRYEDVAELRRRSASHARAKLVELDANHGYAGGCNAGIRLALNAGYDFVFLINNDVVVLPGAVDALLGYLYSDADTGAVAPLVVAVNNTTVLHTDCPLDLRSGRFGWSDHGVTIDEVDRAPRDTGYVCGEAFIARARVFRECGLFDERFFLSFEDTEWSARARRAGWRLRTIPEAVVSHRHGATMGRFLNNYYEVRNYPYFLRTAIGFGPVRASLGGLRFLFCVLAGLLKRRHFSAAHGAIRGWRDSFALLKAM